MVRLTPVVPEDGPALVAFLLSNRFPFHVMAQHTPDTATTFVDNGHFSSENSQGYWISEVGDDDRADDGERQGVAVLEDLQDDTVMIDLRLAAASRGRGLGTATLAALARLAFIALPGARRLEGQTREDNMVMRSAFRSAGFVQEAYFRGGWPTADGSFAGSVSYSMLRTDWESGTMTPLPDDEPHRFVGRRPPT
jgi:RimJ/RimL family protein N-acetyltransferase